MRLMDFIVEGFKEVEARFVASGADQQSVKDSIQKYRDLVNKNQVQGSERNIDWWGKNKTFQEFSDFVELKSVVPTKKQTKRATNVGQSVTLLEDDRWLVVVPLDKDASCFHGKNSDWCTTKRNQQHFKNYFHDQNIILIYCLNKQTGGMWAIANYRNVYEPEDDDDDAMPIEFPVDSQGNTVDYEMFDQQDKSLTPEQFRQQTGFDPFKLMDLSDAQAGRRQPIGQAQASYQNTISQTKRQIYRAVKRDPIIEKTLLSLDSPELSFKYIARLGGRKVDLSGLPEKILVDGASSSVGNRNESILKYIPNAPEKIKLLSMKQQSSALKDLIANGVMPTEDQILQTNLRLSMIRGEFKLLQDNNLITPAIEDALKHDSHGIDNLLNAGYEFTDKDVESVLTKVKEHGHLSSANIAIAVKLIAASGHWPSDAAFKNITDNETYYDPDTSSFKPYYSSAEEVEQQVIQKLQDKIQGNTENTDRVTEKITKKQETMQHLEQEVLIIQQEMQHRSTFGNYRTKEEMERLKRYIDMYQNEINDANQQIKKWKDENLNISKILRRYNKI